MTEKRKQHARCCLLGAVGGILMAAGDWLLGCIPLQETDTGMFERPARPLTPGGCSLFIRSRGTLCSP